MRYQKYNNKKIEINGIKYDSKKEAKRHQELLLLERAGVIKNLQTQVKFELVPAQYETVRTGEFYKIGKKKGQPKTKEVCVEQSVVYYADFVYEEAGKQIVEDTKGMRTTEYIIKRKLMRYIHNIQIKEI
jgi:hypothetical protein